MLLFYSLHLKGNKNVCSDLKIMYYVLHLVLIALKRYTFSVHSINFSGTSLDKNTTCQGSCMGIRQISKEYEDIDKNSKRET